MTRWQLCRWVWPDWWSVQNMTKTTKCQSLKKKIILSLYAVLTLRHIEAWRLPPRPNPNYICLYFTERKSNSSLKVYLVSGFCMCPSGVSHCKGNTKVKRTPLALPFNRKTIKKSYWYFLGKLLAWKNSLIFLMKPWLKS